jgi:hypothetical protein
MDEQIFIDPSEFIAGNAPKRWSNPICWKKQMGM